MQRDYSNSRNLINLEMFPFISLCPRENFKRLQFWKKRFSQVVPIRKILILGKRVFVPFIDGTIMQMVETSSIEDLKTFKPNSWGIPEPTSIEGRAIGIFIMYHV